MPHRRSVVVAVDAVIALIDAIGGAIAIGVTLTFVEATTHARENLVWIIGTFVIAVRSQVFIGICIGHAAPTCTWVNLVFIIGTAVDAVGCVVVVRVGLGKTTATLSGGRFVRIVIAFIDAVGGLVAV